jgi:hypothetical protein
MDDLTIQCPACGRATGRRRRSCIYCGAELPAAEVRATTTHIGARQLEEWEQGYSVICSSSGQATPETARQLADLVRIDADAAYALLECEYAIPVARVALEAEAEFLCSSLRDAGVATEVVPDASLELETVARRVRSIELGEADMVMRCNVAEQHVMRVADVICCVEGRLVASRVDVLEERVRSKRAFDVVEASRADQEIYLVDVYGRSPAERYRIRADGFDYSATLATPALIVDENFRRLTDELKLRFGDRYHSEYKRLTPLLEHAWPAPSRVEARGVSFKGDFKKYTQSAVTSDPVRQFTRYSRYLCWRALSAATTSA